MNPYPSKYRKCKPSVPKKFFAYTDACIGCKTPSGCNSCKAAKKWNHEMRKRKDRKYKQALRQLKY